MPRRATGNAVKHGEKWYARVIVAPKKRKAILLATCGPHDDEAARERASLLADVVGELRQAGRDDFIPTALDKIATLSGSRLSAFVTLARGYATGAEMRSTARTQADRITFRTFAER